jgi:carbon-monoxide dehydrogenase catalytic subunit
MATAKKSIEEKSMWDDAQQMLRKAERDGVETAWDRLEQQTPHCTFCESGLSCRNCTMGPCRISKKAPLGVCGADADVIVARNFGRFVAGGSAGHSDHGRDCIETLHAVAHGLTQDYTIKDEAKLLRNKINGLLCRLILPSQPQVPVGIHQCIKVISLLLGYQSAYRECHQRGLLFNRHH